MPFFVHQTPPVPDGKSPNSGWSLQETWHPIYHFIDDVLDEQGGEAVLFFSSRPDSSLADLLQAAFRGHSRDEVEQAVGEAIRRVFGE